MLGQGHTGYRISCARTDNDKTSGVSSMRTAQEKRKLRRQRKRRNQILDDMLIGSAMAMPALLMWLGLVYMFIIELSR